MYVELHASSAFSFLRGSSLPEDLVERAAELGYPGAHAPRSRRRARRAALLQGREGRRHPPLVGAELTLLGGGALPVHVESRTGYQLCQLVTRMKAGVPKGEGRLDLETLGRTPDADRLAAILAAFGSRNVALEVQRHRRREQEAANRALFDLTDSPVSRSCVEPGFHLLEACMIEDALIVAG